MFLAPDCFGGVPLNFWTCVIKLGQIRSHVAKFQGDRSRELGERVAKKEKKVNTTSILLPCDAMRCTVSVIVILSVCPSVCPSVCLSVTLMECVHMVRPTIMISSPCDSPIILVSDDIMFLPKFEGGHPSEGVE